MSKKSMEEHALYLGKLVGNLLMIEMAARLAIVKIEEYESSKLIAQLARIEKGDLVERNAFTNSDSLKPTLEKYNDKVSVACKIDVPAIVGLRDSLAHGRTFGVGDFGCLKLLKFNQKTDKKSGLISVDMAADMTKAWFSENIQMLQVALDRITIALDYEKTELV